jgi:hypothetical protein
LRKPKHSVLLSLVAATAAFSCAFVLGMFIFSVVSLLYLITFKPYGNGEHWLIPNVLVAAIAMCISALVYRRFRWGKVVAHHDGGGPGFAAGDSEHPTGEHAGQPPLGHGAEAGAARRS